MTHEEPQVTRQQRSDLQLRLLARAQVLRNEVRAALHSESLAGDTNERPVDDSEASVTAARVAHDGDETREIEAALRRLEGGTYGICIDCAAALAWARLDAVPEAARCLRCEARHERLR